MNEAYLCALHGKMVGFLKRKKDSSGFVAFEMGERIERVRQNGTGKCAKCLK
jgi:hypothetical protein